MTANILDIPKPYKDGEPLDEIDLDDCFNSVEEWALSAIRNIQQIAIDTFGSSYSLDNDGSANRATPLYEVTATLNENENITGLWTFQNHIKILDGFDLLLYSDTGSTQTFSIDGATGNLSSSSPSTTQSILSITGSSLTTGNLGYFYSNSSSSSSRNLVEIVNDNSSASSTTLLHLNQDADWYAQYIDGSGVLVNNVFQINADSLTSGGIATFYSNSSNATARNLIYIVNDNASATGAIPLYIKQDANQKAARFDGIGTTTDSVLYLAGDVLTTGKIATFYSNSSDSSSRNLVFIHNDNASATNAIGLNIQQDVSGIEALRISNSGGTPVAGIYNDGQMYLADVDPPIANHLNRNSGVKGGVYYDQGIPSILFSYNVSSVTDNSAGYSTINWNTNFSGTDINSVVTSTRYSNSASPPHVATVHAGAGTTDVYTYFGTNSANVADHFYDAIAIGDQ